MDRRLLVLLAVAALAGFSLPFVIHRPFHLGHDLGVALPASGFEFHEEGDGGVVIEAEPYPMHAEHNEVPVENFRVDRVRAYGLLGVGFERSTTLVETGSDRWTNTSTEEVRDTGRVVGERSLLTNESRVTVEGEEIREGDVIRVKAIHEGKTGLSGLRRGWRPSQGVETQAEYEARSSTGGVGG